MKAFALDKEFLDKTQYIDSVMLSHYKYIVRMESCTIGRSQLFYTNNLRDALNSILKELNVAQTNLWVSLTRHTSFHGLHLTALKKRGNARGRFCLTLHDEVRFNHQLVF